MNAAVAGLVDALDELANWHDYTCDAVIGGPCDCKAKVARAALAAFEKRPALRNDEPTRGVLRDSWSVGLDATLDAIDTAVLGPREPTPDEGVTCCTYTHNGTPCRVRGPHEYHLCGGTKIGPLEPAGPREPTKETP